MYSRIVVGTDGSARSMDAVRAAAELARLGRAEEVHVVAACRPYSRVDMERMEAKLPKEFHNVISPHFMAEERFGEAEDEIKRQGLSMVQHEASGGPADAILTVAEKVDADLIVVGARGLSAVGRFLRGSVSTKVAHHSPCDVLIVEHDD